MIVTSSISRPCDDDDDDDDVTHQSPLRRSGSSFVAGSVPLEVVSGERHLSTNTHFRPRFTGTTMTMMMLTQQKCGSGGESPEVTNRKRCRSFAGDLEDNADFRNAGRTGGGSTCCLGHVTTAFGRSADVEDATVPWDALPFRLPATLIKKQTKLLTDDCGAGPHERDTPV